MNANNIKQRDKSCCFLCLRDSSNEDVPFPSSSKTIPPQSQPTLSHSIASFQRLCFQLGILISNTIQPNDDNNFNGNIRFCGSCSVVVARLSELFQVQDLLNKKVNQDLANICGIINDADSKQNRKEDKKCNGISNEYHGNITEEQSLGWLRKLVTEKCSLLVTSRDTNGSFQLPEMKAVSESNTSTKIFDNPKNGFELKQKSMAEVPAFAVNHETSTIPKLWSGGEVSALKPGPEKGDSRTDREWEQKCSSDLLESNDSASLEPKAYQWNSCNEEHLNKNLLNDIEFVNSFDSGLIVLLEHEQTPDDNVDVHSCEPPSATKEENATNSDLVAVSSENKDEVSDNKKQSDVSNSILATNPDSPKVRLRLFKCNACGTWLKSKRKLVRYKSQVKPEAESSSATKSNTASTQTENQLQEDHRPLKVSNLKHVDKNKNVGQFKCDLCNKTFSRSAALSLHRRTVHYDGPRFKCNICQKATLKTERQLKRHQKTCQRKRTISSSTGGEAYSSSEQLLPPHVCGTCGKRFHQRHHLLRHGTVHSSDRPFSCGGCGRAFKDNQQRRQHQKYHCKNPNGAKGLVPRQIRKRRGREIQRQAIPIPQPKARMPESVKELNGDLILIKSLPEFRNYKY